MIIYAFIVTYNRLELLKKVIHCLEKQTMKIDKIFVVNNNSTDGTGEWLANQSNVFVITQENLGGAGGFHTGVKYAYENGADWVWMMDDDVFPDADCLSILMKYSSAYRCMIPTRYYSDGSKVYWGGNFDLKKNKTNLLAKDCRDEVSIVNTGCFEGMLIHRSIIQKVGFPDQRFFIAGDDTIYGYLISRFTVIALINLAIMHRALSQNEQLNKRSPMYTYYSIRNFHLLEEYYCLLFEKKCYPVVVYLCRYYTLARSLFSYFIKNKTESKALINALIRGVNDSCRKLTGKTFS